MPILFYFGMFFLSFVPLWICIICISVKSLFDGTVCPYTEWISLILIGVMSVVSIVSIAMTLKSQTDENSTGYSVKKAEKDIVSTSEYILSNALPLLAFDFTYYFDVIQFMVVFGFLMILCLMHYRCVSNVCLELAGYCLYDCQLVSSDSGQRDARVLIRTRQLNTNDIIKVYRVNDELYIGKRK